MLDKAFYKILAKNIDIAAGAETYDSIKLRIPCGKVIWDKHMNLCIYETVAACIKSQLTHPHFHHNSTKKKHN